ncbi:MAG TPA: DUF6401 family natural product biosynthesis protein [Trebonia sp.]|jgi:hypothetical protein|nr:DUF6401 family natural product biosynthesis protein [Trebonia sp.]
MPFSDQIYVDLPGMVLRLAGEVGQVSLARSADDAGARASVDQHASDIRDALTRTGRKITPAGLLSYAQGFTEAAIARGWSPADRQEHDPWDEEPLLDWESLRLAAVCRMFIEAQGLGITS